MCEKKRVGEAPRMEGILDWGAASRRLSHISVAQIMNVFERAMCCGLENRLNNGRPLLERHRCICNKLGSSQVTNMTSCGQLTGNQN